jgi:site-specific DNA recombinase
MNALGYLRLSAKDQSKSLEYQETNIRDYCLRNKLEVVGMFRDNGRSSFTFDRPDYQALEAFIKKHKGKCQYLIVLDHDRFSRNLPEALMKISELEEKYGVKVLSTSERVDLDTTDPDVFMKRAFDYLMANKELFNIRHRTKQGVRNAKEKGRYLGRAPYGYRNIVDGSKRNLIEIDETKAFIIEKVFRDYLLGIAPYIIHKSIKDMGFTNKGHSAIRDILSNCVYAGLIRVPAYRELPEKYVKAIHPPIVSEEEFWLVQKMLVNKRRQQVRPDEDFPLRGILRCACGQSMTAGWSKGRRQYYLYYRCVEHTNINVPGKMLHEKFDQLLRELSFRPHQVVFLTAAHALLSEEPMQQKKDRQNKNIQALKSINEKIYLLEERYVNNEIEKSTYQNWFPKFQEEKLALELLIKGKNEKIQTAENAVFDGYIPYMKNIFDIYDKCNIYQKHAIIRGVFKQNLVWGEGELRTPLINPVFEDKLLIIKEKGLLFYEQPFRNQDKSPISTQCRSRTGTVSHRCLRPARLPIPPTGHFFFSGTQIYH